MATDNPITDRPPIRRPLDPSDQTHLFDGVDYSVHPSTYLQPWLDASDVTDDELHQWTHPHSSSVLPVGEDWPPLAPWQEATPS